MSPEAHFSKRSKRLYKALRKHARNLETPENVVLIPGRYRATEARHETVYLSVRRYIYGSTVYDTYRERVFYFDHKPSRREFRQIVRLMLEAMS